MSTMKKPAVVLVALLTCYATAIADPWVREGGPGGGGNWRSVDVNSSGRAILGGDVSGLYLRDSNDDVWTHYGYASGLTATSVYQVKWSRYNPSVALAGTGSGMYFSVYSGEGWAASGTSDFDSDHVTAVAWGNTVADSMKAFALWPSGSSFKFAVGTLSYPGGGG